MQSSNILCKEHLGIANCMATGYSLSISGGSRLFTEKRKRCESERE